MRKKYLIPAVVTAISLLFTSFAYAENPFTDLDGYDWAAESIDYLYGTGIVKGVETDKFGPEQYMKRGDYALLLTRYFGLSSSSASNYEDVKANAYYASATATLKEYKVVTTGFFYPERALTREDAVGMIYNTVYNTTGVSDEAFSDDPAYYYLDYKDIKWDKVNAVATLTKMGIVDGYDTMFHPKDNITRAQIAALFYKMSAKGLPPAAAATAAPTALPADTIAPDVTVSPATPVPTEAAVSSGSLTVTTDTTDEQKSYSSNADGNTLLVTNGTYSGTSCNIAKTGGSADESQSALYGANAAVLVKGASAGIYFSAVSASSATSNSRGVFVTDNAAAKIDASTVITTGDNSDALRTANGAKANVINTRLSAAGKDSMVMYAGKDTTISGEELYVTASGKGGAGLYSEGQIALSNSTVSASDLGAAVINGGSATLIGDDIQGLSCNGLMFYCPDKKRSSSAAAVTMLNTKISAVGAPLFYATNADATLNLTSCTLTPDSNYALISSKADDWGSDALNGGNITVNASSQSLTGNIEADIISSVTLALTNASSLNGAVNKDNYALTMSVSLDSSSSWNVSADSYVDVLSDDDTTFANIKSNGHKIYYDAANEKNAALASKTITLSDGGELLPGTIL